MLTGIVRDKQGNPIAGAQVELKNESFQTLFSTVSDDEGNYTLDAQPAVYPFLIAVKDYAVNNLEYWCQNLDLRQDVCLDIRFDRLEVYGLHAFYIKGGVNPLMVYFRPMSLNKFLAGEQDIAPEIHTVQAKLDGETVPVLRINPVKEMAEDQAMTAYLVQLEAKNQNWKKLEISLWDTQGNFGMAAIFNG